MNPNPYKFNGTYISNTFYGGWRRSAINCGECYSWAYIAYKIFYEVSIELWSTDSEYHAFIKIHDKFYDSQRPNGIIDWRQLPCIREGVGSYTADRYSLRDFQELWRVDGDHHWKQLDKKIAKALKGKT
jgi:hypothetical protein